MCKPVQRFSTRGDLLLAIVGSALRPAGGGSCRTSERTWVAGAEGVGAGAGVLGEVEGCARWAGWAAGWVALAGQTCMPK